LLTEKALENLHNLEGYIGTYDTFEDFIEQNPDYHPKENDLIYCILDDVIGIYTPENEWHKIKIPEDNKIDTGISTYDLNKSAIKQLGPAKEGELRHARGEMNKINRTSNNEYYMLLFKDISYYTVLHNTKTAPKNDTLGTVVMDCLKNIGTIYSINETESSSTFEIWVETQSGEMMVGYLFPYDQGIVEIQKGGLK